ncbi:2804_t:CDS:2, partial [Funneliformis caledonium]
MENSLNEEELHENENIDESQKIANQTYVKTSCASAISLSIYIALSDTSNRRPLSDERYELNDSTRMKNCGRNKEDAMHNKRTCNEIYQTYNVHSIAKFILHNSPSGALDERAEAFWLHVIHENKKNQIGVGYYCQEFWLSMDRLRRNKKDEISFQALSNVAHRN